MDFYGRTEVTSSRSRSAEGPSRSSRGEGLGRPGEVGPPHDRLTIYGRPWPPRLSWLQQRASTPLQHPRLAAGEQGHQCDATALPRDVRSCLLPGRTGQLLVVPRKGDFITRPDPYYDSNARHALALRRRHSPDVHGPCGEGGAVLDGRGAARHRTNARRRAGCHDAADRDGACPAGARERASGRPRVIVLLVLDGMRRDYFDRHAASMPTLTALRRRSAWFTQAQVNVLPSNTAVGHSTIATGADPGVHGITGVSTYDWQGRRRHDMFAGCDPQDLLAPTIADVWQRATAGRAVILAQGSIDRAATPLAGHGACLQDGTPVVLASYDQQTGAWHSNPTCFRLPDYLKDVNASTLWKASPEWMGHSIDSTTAVRYSALFPKFEPTRRSP